MMVILAAVLAIVVAGLPLSAVVLVTVACRQEETAHSMAAAAPGRLARAARQVLAFSASGISRPDSREPAAGYHADIEPLMTAGTGH